MASGWSGPEKVDAVKGYVLIEGPGVNVTLTPALAVEVAGRLIEKAAEAEGQRRIVKAPNDKS